jgi:hypothetical protein
MVVALVAAGCGGGDGNGSTGAQGGGDTTKLEGLIPPNTLTVGTELPAPPFWIGDDDKITGGFEVDFAKEMAKRLGINQVKFVEMPFPGPVAGQPCDRDIDFSQVTVTRSGTRWSTSPSRTSTPTRGSWPGPAPWWPAWTTPSSSSGAPS